MSKFIMVGLLVGALLAGAAPVMAQQANCPGQFCQGGIGDPLTLAASGVVIPFFTDLSTVSTLQVASPVSDNPDAHLFFFDANCARIPISVGIPLTTNDIAFQQIGSEQNGPVATGTNGLVTLAKSDPAGFTLVPLDAGHPLHARMYLFSAVDGRSRVIEPIIVNTAEFPSTAHWWSPLRTGGNFFAPLQTTVVKTDLILVCPKNSIQGGEGAAFGGDAGGLPPFTDTGFPQIEPNFPALTGGPLSNVIRVRIYDTNEIFKRDFTIDCNCVIRYTSIAETVNPFYADPVEAAFGTYTELTSVPGNATTRVTFTGYTSVFTVGSPINAFFARIQNGSQLSMDGALTDRR